MKNRSLRIVSAILLAGFTLSACNTVKGAGRDVESIGQKGEEIITDKK